MMDLLDRRFILYMKYEVENEASTYKGCIVEFKSIILMLLTWMEIMFIYHTYSS